MNDEEKQKHYAMADKLFSEQNFGAAVIIGVGSMLLAAAAYGIVVAKWPFSYGFAMAGIGIAVGISMQFLGRGVTTKFAVLAALYTIVGCLLGNVFRVINSPGVLGARSPLDALQKSSLSELLEQSTSYLSLGNLIYLFVAIVAAVFLVKRPLSRSQRLAIGLSNLRT